ncbi:hypothetical protein SASPL_134781 [Salvia splendens]|uniref:Uncharacterized protein n=1 Tax=Salvia splendens TaxID=180675 RepID=A0A8X8ZG05_SALSN|nr:hypothetical protein SASPL_134781 [Salvia splendens]
MRRPPPPPENRPSLPIVKGQIGDAFPLTFTYPSLSSLTFPCRVDAKGSAAARNPPLPLPRKRKSGETPNRSWVVDHLRPRDNYVKATSKICVSMVRDMYNVRADWPDDFNVDLALYLITKVQSIEHDHHDQAALSLLKDGPLRIWFPVFRDFALTLLSLCKVDGNLWADRLTQHLIQYIGMKLQSSTKQPDADADDANPSKKLKGS